ncbi:hypothetical protein RHGRI_006083 [Rhododendron griersonianum]|uniref:NLP1-9 GAF domain-containing protein n=1 Tax=Rhododendron griersonianum TaxID=479676 RepID=A0AAV6LFQ0_9ERIC|nr:hypothetical protein RHGRI_006083 [Rhododendron griersonianum]
MMMPIHGSVDDAHTILLGVEEELYFTPNFNEYIRNERLNWSRFDGNPNICGSPTFGWVFWSQLGKSSLSFSLAFFFLLLFLGAQPLFSFTDNSADLIRQAIQKLISTEDLPDSLVQFWAATKTSEGRTLLTTQFQPFALGPTYSAAERDGLCEYRMGMCRKYNNSFYADAECAQELLGLPGRVFLNQLPESTPRVELYTLKEYPQRDLALRCKIVSSVAVPVFEHSSHTCVGVLEIAPNGFMGPVWHGKSILGQMYDIFQEVGLQCFDGYKHYEQQIGDENIAFTTAFLELKMVLETVCKIHKLPLAMTWVPCSACNDLRRGQLLSEGVEFIRPRNHWPVQKFMEVSKCSHLRKGVVAGMVVSSHNMLYCSDITKLSLVEYPFVPHARHCNFRGVCPGATEIVTTQKKKNRYRDYSWTSLSLILGTMEENFRTFKLASGLKLGDLLSVEVIDFLKGQKLRSVQKIQAKGGGEMLQIRQLDQVSMGAIHSGTNVVSEDLFFYPLVSEDQNYILPSLEALQNGEVTMQLDSSHQPPLDPPNNGQNVVIAERNIVTVTSSEERKRKTQREHKETGVRIEVLLDDILKCAKLKRKGAAKKLQDERKSVKEEKEWYGENQGKRNYKSHSLRCTESFNRENVVGELQQLQTNDETKQKMLEILKRFHSEEEVDSMDEDDSTLSEETMEKILSGDQIGLDDLSAEEKKRFQRAVASGELSKLIEPWEPWWLKPSARTISLSREGTQLIQPLSNEETVTSAQHGPESDPAHDIPPGPETPLPPINKLSSTEPSPLLAVHLIDIIYTYCFTLRLYNGDWESDPIGASMDMLSVSSVLGQGGQPESVSEALSHCLEQTCSPAFRHMGGLQFGLGLLDDVIALLSLGGAALVCLLCDLQRLVQAAEGELKSESEKQWKSKRGEIRSKLKLGERKIYFIMCWVHEQPREAWCSMAALVNAEKGSAMEFAGNRGGTLRMQNRVEARGKALIEELE